MTVFACPPGSCLDTNQLCKSFETNEISAGQVLTDKLAEMGYHSEVCPVDFDYTPYFITAFILVFSILLWIFRTPIYDFLIKFTSKTPTKNKESVHSLRAKYLEALHKQTEELRNTEEWKLRELEIQRELRGITTEDRKNKKFLQSADKGGELPSYRPERKNPRNQKKSGG